MKKEALFNFLNRIFQLIKTNKVFFYSFIIFLLIFLAWWLAFFPALMTSDSFDQWKEALTFKFKNGSPYLYALIMSLLRFFYDSPASMVIFQALIFVGILSLFFNYAWKKGVSKIWIIITGLFFIIWPQFGIYTITLWKDVVYSLFALAFGLLAFVAVTDEKLRLNKYIFFGLAFTAALAAFFRFNGIIFLFLPPLFFLIFKVFRIKKLILLTVSTLAIYFFFAVILFSLLRVQPVPAMIEGLMIKNVGAIYALETPNLNEFEKTSFESMNSIKDWKHYYDCTSANELVFDILRDKKTGAYSPRLEPDKVKDDNFRKAFYSASLRNPVAFLLDKACLSNTMLGIGRVNSFRYTDTIVRGWWHPIVVEDSKLSGLKDFLKNYLVWTTKTKVRSDIFWATWPPTILFFVALGIAIWKKFKGLGIYSLLVISNLLTVIALVPAIDYRYVYFVYLCVPFLPLLYLLESKKQKANH